MKTEFSAEEYEDIICAMYREVMPETFMLLAMDVVNDMDEEIVVAKLEGMERENAGTDLQRQATLCAFRGIKRVRDSIYTEPVNVYNGLFGVHFSPN